MIALILLSKKPKKFSHSLAEHSTAKNSQGRKRTTPSLMEELSKKLEGMIKGRQMQYLANILFIGIISQ